LLFRIYLVIIAVIGSVAFRKTQANTEDFFLANRTVGSMVFFLSLFATNMTAFVDPGQLRTGVSARDWYLRADGRPLQAWSFRSRFFFIWDQALGAREKRFGHPNAGRHIFRDRWECSTIGTVIFCVKRNHARAVHDHQHHGRRAGS
jgi:hypothetical protein